MPYVNVHIDAEDYISDIRTERLERELKRRGVDLDKRIIDRLKDDLALAWEHRDETAFGRALSLLVDPQKEDERRARLANQYHDFMQQIRSTQ